MVGAVIPTHCFTTVSQSEVLVTVAARNDQMVGFWRDVSRSSPTYGVVPLEVSVHRAAALAVTGH